MHWRMLNKSDIAQFISKLIILATAVHVYQEFGFNELPGPLVTAQHSLMDQFLVKKIQ